MEDFGKPLDLSSVRFPGSHNLRYIWWMQGRVSSVFASFCICKGPTELSSVPGEEVLEEVADLHISQDFHLMRVREWVAEFITGHIPDHSEESVNGGLDFRQHVRLYPQEASIAHGTEHQADLGAPQSSVPSPQRQCFLLHVGIPQHTDFSSREGQHCRHGSGITNA